MSASVSNPLAGRPAPASLLVDVPKLVWAYYAPGSGADVREQRVAFGTSGHRGSGWFAARPSGTEHVYKLYAESFRGNEHLGQIQDQAQALIKKILRGTEKSQ